MVPQAIILKIENIRTAKTIKIGNAKTYPKILLANTLKAAKNGKTNILNRGKKKKRAISSPFPLSTPPKGGSTDTATTKKIKEQINKNLDTNQRDTMSSLVGLFLYSKTGGFDC